MDFTQLTDEQRAKFDKALDFLEQAKMAASGYPTKQGIANLREIKAAGGVSSEDAQLASAYRAWKFGSKYKPLDASTLATHGIPQQEIDRMEGERRAAHERESTMAYDILVKPPDQEMEPIEITAKAPRAAKKKEGAAAISSPVKAPVISPPAQVVPAPVPVDSSIPGPPPMQAGDPLLRQGTA